MWASKHLTAVIRVAVAGVITGAMLILLSQIWWLWQPVRDNVNCGAVAQHLVAAVDAVR